MDTNGNQMEQPAVQHRSAGPVVGIIIVIALLVVGALYAWKAKRAAVQPEPTAPAAAETDSLTQEYMDAGTSTDPDAIESDLLDTDLESLDADLGGLLIETE